MPQIYKILDSDFNKLFIHTILYFYAISLCSIFKKKKLDVI